MDFHPQHLWLVKQSAGLETSWAWGPRTEGRLEATAARVWVQQEDTTPPPSQPHFFPLLTGAC